MARGCWLVKTEPDVYSIDRFAAEGRTVWDGVRSHEAQNALRDGMKVGDEVLVYHSNADPSAIVGTARVVREAYPDASAWTKGHRYADPASDPRKPTWFCVDLAFESRLACPLTLERIKEDAGLRRMALVTRPRLSVQPVRPAERDRILALAGPARSFARDP